MLLWAAGVVGAGGGGFVLAAWLKPPLCYPITPFACRAIRMEPWGSGGLQAALSFSRHDGGVVKNGGCHLLTVFQFLLQSQAISPYRHKQPRAGDRVSLAACVAFVGHPRRLAAEGGRKGVSWPSVSSSDLLSATTGTVLLQPCPPPQPAFNPTVCLPKIATSLFHCCSAGLGELGARGGVMLDL